MSDKDYVSLKEYFLSMITAIESSRKLAFDAMDKRLEGMNEFRAALKDQASGFITRAEHNLILKEIQDLREFRIKLESKADQSSVNKVSSIAIVGLILSFIGLVVSIVGLIMRFVR